MSFAIHALQQPTDVQIDQLVQVCLKAYDPEDASVKTLVGGDTSLLDAFFRASIRVGARGGQIYIATEGTDGTLIRGMALWWGPGAEPFNTEEQRQELSVFVSRLTIETQEWHRKIYRPDFANLTERLLGPRGKLDSWYLNLLAVDPQHRRLGAARALIDAVRAKANHSVLTLAATNDLNVGIYRRMGFRVRGSMRMKGMPRIGNFTVSVLSWSETDGVATTGDID